MLNYITTKKCTAVFHFFLALTFFYFMDRSLVFFIELLAGFFSQNITEPNYIFNKSWGALNFFIVSVFVFMLLGGEKYSNYRKAFLCVFLYFFFVFLVKVNFLAKNEHLLSSEDFYFRLAFEILILCALYILFLKLGRVISLYENIKRYLSQ
ncbi:hypothetical protein SAMN05216210_0963 [Halopseudomonas salegens]|uniref:Uncharacterized protein n=1 Tax=Halopseudomonas salegens TaxID=1434072 RepID=A0A1H2ERH1_9GAMM|nr:hypothetical protein SAMN05216210_0963 [Halopseudomonas salegens]